MPSDKRYDQGILTGAQKIDENIENYVNPLVTALARKEVSVKTEV